MTACIRPARQSRKASCRAVALPGTRVLLILSKLKADNDDQRVGIEICTQGVYQEFGSQFENAGEDGAVIRARSSMAMTRLGFRCATGGSRTCHRMIDPTKVVRTSAGSRSVGSLIHHRGDGR